MNDVLQDRLNKKYDAGFTTNVESTTKKLEALSNAEDKQTSLKNLDE